MGANNSQCYYTPFGFHLTKETHYVAFDKELIEQRYDLLLAA